MSVAAAFLCNGGFVMCADSQEAWGDLKTEAIKISSNSGDGGTFVFAGAGDTDVLEYTVERLRQELGARQHHPGPWVTGLDPRPDNLPEDTIRRVVKEVRKQSILPFHAWPNPPSFDLLIGTMIRGTPQIYVANPRVVRPLSFERCESVGLGIIQAKTICERLYNPYFSRAQTELFAIYLMRQVKRFVQFVGGETHLVSVHFSGQEKWWKTKDVRAAEDVFDRLEKHEQALVGSLFSRTGTIRACVSPDESRTEIGDLQQELLAIAMPLEQAFLLRCVSPPGEPEL